MRTAKSLRESWNRNADLREGWRRILETPEWRAVSEMVAAEATERARVIMRSDPDPILARNLSNLDGAIAAIESMQAAAQEPAPPVEHLEDYNDAYVMELQKRKLQNQ